MTSAIDATKPIAGSPTTASVRAQFTTAASEITSLQANGIEALTTAEVDQLENIGTTTISAAQWVYLGASDQALATSDSITHVNFTATGYIYSSLTNSITAGTTQTQAGATALTTDVNVVTVSGTNGDGVKLPTAVAGSRVLIINDDAAQTIQIWPNTSDTIDGGSADAVDSNTLAAGIRREYTAADGTDWITVTAAGGGSGDLVSTNNLSDVSNAGTSRTNLGLAIGTDVQAYDVDLTELATAYTSEAATTAASIAFLEGTNNGTNKVTLIGPASTADVTVTLPAAADTLVGKATTDTFTNKTFNANGTGNSLSNVDVADLANGTDGELITWSSSAAPATVAVGTATHVLTSNGVGAAPTFQAAGGSGVWVTISSTTLTTESTFNVDLSSTTYKDWQIRIYNMAVSAAAESVHLLYYTDGGSTPIGAAYDWCAAGREHGVALDGHGGAAASQIEIGRFRSASNVWGTDAGENGSGILTIFFPRDAGITHSTWQIGGNTAANNAWTSYGNGFNTTAEDCTDIRLLPASGTFDGAIIEVLGYKE
jgi:hypothetical protein